MVKEAFGKRVYEAMLAKGWTQSELARRSNIPRDSVSNYIRGNSIPSPKNLQLLASALSVEPEELLPALTEVFRPENVVRSFDFSEVAPGKVRLQVNKVVRLATAMKIGQLISEEDAKSTD